MEPDKARQRQSPKTHRDEFEVACYARELGRTIQRKMFQQKMDTPGSTANCAHGEDSSFDSHASPPQHDRAG